MSAHVRSCPFLSHPFVGCRGSPKKPCYVGSMNTNSVAGSVSWLKLAPNRSLTTECSLRARVPANYYTKLDFLDSDCTSNRHFTVKSTNCFWTRPIFARAAPTFLLSRLLACSPALPSSFDLDLSRSAVSGFHLTGLALRGHTVG